MWRADADKTAVPDAEREWYAVRRRIRGGAETGAARPARPRRSLLMWIAIPLGAAAALALSLSVALQKPATTPAVRVTWHVASADSVEVPGSNASTMVFVDDKSGWLIVWASDEPKRG